MAGEHRDVMINYLDHGAQTLQVTSVRSILALISMLDLKVWSTDVKLAYLQSETALTRDMYIKNPADEFELEPNQ